MRRLLCCLYVVSGLNYFSQSNSLLLDSILKSNTKLNKLIKSEGQYSVQIIYTQINRDSLNRPSFVVHNYNADRFYFYSASLVKLPVSIFALEKINNLKIEGLNRNSKMITERAGFCQKEVLSDLSAFNGNPSVELYIKKMLLVSDNDSYSRLLEFLNPDYIKARSASLGFPEVRITNRFDTECIGKGNTLMNPVSFLNTEAKVVYRQAVSKVSAKYNSPIGALMGDISLKECHKDFSASNYIKLATINGMLKKLIFEAGSDSVNRYSISPGDRDFLMWHLGAYPRESTEPLYNSKEYFDSYKKYFIYGGKTPEILRDTLRIYNVVGRSYGFLSDCAYIVNPASGLEFMLSAVIYTNERNCFGSGRYEYETIGLPFLQELSLALYSLENVRPKRLLALPGGKEAKGQ